MSLYTLCQKTYSVSLKNFLSTSVCAELNNYLKLCCHKKLQSLPKSLAHRDLVDKLEKLLLSIRYSSGKWIYSAACKIIRIFLTHKHFETYLLSLLFLIFRLYRFKFEAKAITIYFMASGLLNKARDIITYFFFWIINLIVHVMIAVMIKL